MANPHVGEVEIVAGGKTYCLRLSMRAIITVEKHFGKPINRVISEHFGNPESFSAEEMLTVLWATLQHLPEKPSQEQVVDIFDEVGLLESSKVLSQLITLNFSGEAGDGDADENPQTAAAE